MRLLRFKEDGIALSLVQHLGSDIPPYAVLSHKWGPDDEEVTFADLQNGVEAYRGKAGYHKIQFCGKQALKDGLKYFWVDTCCIDKASSAELSEGINSMFYWYQCAARCYVYMPDVSSTQVDTEGEYSRRWKPAFRRSRWFSRGWTLQELLAPKRVDFYSVDEEWLGDKLSLEETLYEITAIPVAALRGCSLTDFSKEERLSWAATRQTKREEDEAYCLFGLFDIQIPILYGERREKAMRRLLEEIDKYVPCKASVEKTDSKAMLNAEQKQTLLKSLQFEQIDERRDTIKIAHASTCRWLLERPEYIDWLDPMKIKYHHGFLWIKGKPGAGKSTLMKFALAHAEETMQGAVIISFFFNARGDELEKSTDGTYRSMLLQLFEKLPDLQNVLDSLRIPSSSIKANHKWRTEILKTLIERAILRMGSRPLICFIDALDECEEQQIRDMLYFLEGVGETAVSENVRFNICLSSRHYPHITIRRGISLILEEQQGHFRDIKRYLETNLKIGESEVAHHIKLEIRERSSGVFLWVCLVVRILNQQYDNGRIHALRQTLSELPGHVHELFRDMFTRDSQNKNELLLCLQWVLFSTRPLSPEELYLAVLSGIEPENSAAYYHTKPTRDDISRYLVSSSKGLVQIVAPASSNPTVQFIHESVKDFLLKKNGLQSIYAQIGSNFIAQSHERLKQCCLTFINEEALADFERLIKHPSLSNPSVASEEDFNLLLCDVACDAWPFLEYATGSVLSHAELAASDGCDQTKFIDAFPSAIWIYLHGILYPWVKRDSMPAKYLLLFETVTSGFMCLTKLLIEKGEIDLSVKNNDNATLIHASVYANEPEAVQLLLDTNKIDPNAKDARGRTALSLAAKRGYTDITRSLLNRHQVDVNCREDQNGYTPLHRATTDGREDIIQLLLNTGQIDFNSRDNHGRTPLSLATENGKFDIVRLLLNQGQFDVNTKQNNGQTPLLNAMHRGDFEIVKLLLDTGQVDANLADNPQRQTPLSWAIRTGSMEVVKLLVNASQIDLNARDTNGRTPLSWAAASNHASVVKLLIDTGQVDLDSRDRFGRTPLSLAAGNGGRKEAMQRLIDTGKVDINSKDNCGRTPLFHAIDKANEENIKILLATGLVDVNWKDKDHHTPLDWTKRYSDEEVTKLLRCKFQQNCASFQLHKVLSGIIPPQLSLGLQAYKIFITKRHLDQDAALK